MGGVEEDFLAMSLNGLFLHRRHDACATADDTSGDLAMWPRVYER